MNNPRKAYVVCYSEENPSPVAVFFDEEKAHQWMWVYRKDESHDAFIAELSPGDFSQIEVRFDMEGKKPPILKASEWAPNPQIRVVSSEEGIQLRVSLSLDNQDKVLGEATDIHDKWKEDNNFGHY